MTVTMNKKAYQLFHDCAKTLSRIEHNGIRIDTVYLQQAIHETTAEMRQLEAKLKKTEVWQRWVKKYGRDSNLDSPEQIGKILYGKKKEGGLGYEVFARTATGRPKVSEAALERLPDQFCKDYVRWKRLGKTRNTFLRGIEREMVDGVLHPNYNLHLMLSYRSSSDQINMQNMPVRNNEQGRLVRQCFIPRPGHRMVEIDFSGIEVRVAACYCKDPNLIAYIEDKTTDMHRDTACRLFFLEPDQVSKQLRHTAKNKFVFPQFYGSYYVDCALAMWDEINRQGTKLSGSETTVLEHLAKHGVQSRGRCDPEHKPVKDTFEYQVKQTEDWFWNKRFKVYTDWKKVWWNAYLRRGWFKSYTGFAYAGYFRRNQVLNLMIQGSAFHCLAWCLVEMDKWLRQNKMRSMIVNEVHDSMWLDAHEDELQDVLNEAHNIMTKRLPKEWPWLIVPIETETEVAPMGKSIADKQVWVPDKSSLWNLKV